jgi:alpha-L-fucosidase
MALGGFVSPVKAVRLAKDGTPVAFEQRGHRILLKNLPAASPDSTAGIAVLELEFDGAPEFHRASYYPQLHGGMDWAGDKKL